MADDPDDPPALPEEERRAVRLAFAARRDRQRRAGAGFAGALAATVGAGVLFRLPEEYWVPVVGALALAAVAFNLANWKCPACGARLPTRRPTRECPDCGVPLE